MYRVPTSGSLMEAYKPGEAVTSNNLKQLCSW